MTNETDSKENGLTAESWETELANFLVELSDVQSQVLEVLVEKRKMLSGQDTSSRDTVSKREDEVAKRLQGCHERRTQLLNSAASLGLPNDSIASLAAALPSEESRREMNEKVSEARSQARILQHHSVTNWMVCQRTLIHLSQMLEIIATGGRLQPTYGKGASKDTSGSLINREV